MDVSENRDTPKSSILIGFSIINHPFWGPTPIFRNPHILPESIFNLLPVFPWDSEATEHHHGVMSLWLMTAASLKSEGLDSDVLI